MSDIRNKTVSFSNDENDLPLVVDLTQEEDEQNKPNSDVQEDSDYKMALMLSQQELNSLNEEAKHRKAREREDFQIALKLSQDNMEDETEPEKQNDVYPSINTDEKNEIMEISDPSQDLPDINLNGHENDPICKVSHDSIPTNIIDKNTPTVLPITSENDQNGLLSEFENESIIWRGQIEENYSFTDSVEITPPSKLISTPLSIKKRKNYDIKNNKNSKFIKSRQNKGSKKEISVKSCSEDSSGALLLDEIRPNSSHNELLNDNPVFKQPSLTKATIDLPEKDISLRDDISIPSSNDTVKEIPSASEMNKSKTSGKRKVRDVKSATSDSNKKQRTPKKYIPKPGSGGYAILIALLYNESSPNYKGYLTKDELIDASQPFANQSMRYSQPGVKFSYCGYSASSILVKKELISKSKNPVQIRYD